MQKEANFPKGPGTTFKKGKRYYIPSKRYLEAKQAYDKGKTIQPSKKGFRSVNLKYTNLEEYLDTKSKVHHSYCEKIMSIVLIEHKSRS